MGLVMGVVMGVVIVEAIHYQHNRWPLRYIFYTLPTAFQSEIFECSNLSLIINIIMQSEAYMDYWW